MKRAHRPNRAGVTISRREAFVLAPVFLTAACRQAQLDPWQARRLDVAM
jgi:hypothetical protein